MVDVVRRIVEIVLELKDAANTEEKADWKAGSES